MLGNEGGAPGGGTCPGPPSQNHNAGPAGQESGVDELQGICTHIADVGSIQDAPGSPSPSNTTTRQLLISTSPAPNNDETISLTEHEEPEKGRARLGRGLILGGHGNQPIATPGPSVNMRQSTIGSSVHDQVGQGSPLGALPQNSTRYLPAKSSPSIESPVPKRSRDRDFSLRRSRLYRTITERPENNEGLELDPIKSSLSQVTRRNSNEDQATPKKSMASDTVSPGAKIIDAQPQPPKLVNQSSWRTSLPDNGRNVREESALSRLFAECKRQKEALRRIILQIHDVPPSKDGRHISLDLNRRYPLIDERRGHEYVNNVIRSSRYTLYNFVPRQLYAQFSKLANFYFLCVSILQMIPGLSTTGTYTTIVPLLFFVSISIAKEGYDDLRRYKLDKAENRLTTWVLRALDVAPSDTSDTAQAHAHAGGSKQWAKTKWQDVRVGDMVKLYRDEAAPADLLVFNAHGTESIAYIETMALDGETNLKAKQPSPSLARSCRSLEDIAKCKVHMVVEDPNLDLYNFEGRITVGDETLPLTNNEIIYRGSVLRNTSEAMGMVIYTGEECKIRMNATKNPRIKAPALQSVVNKVVMIIVIFVIFLAALNTVEYEIWRKRRERKSWYLTNAHVAFIPILTSFIILFNTMIPLSLYVSLEIVKLFQMFLMNDIEMYDEASNTPMEARTSTINEDLGQVNYIFSDKTGTLTDNSMQFRKMSVAGAAWLHDRDLRVESTIEASRRMPLEMKPNTGSTSVKRLGASSPGTPAPIFGESPLAEPSTVGPNGSVASLCKPSAEPDKLQQTLNTVELLQYIRHRPDTVFAQKAQLLLLSIALCHTCFPEIKENGKIQYQAASADEQALVRAAQELGYIVIDRQNGSMKIKTYPSGPYAEPLITEYQVLDVIEFSSTRKRMSVIVRLPSQKICLFCKGADSTVMQLLRLSKLAATKAVEVERRVSRRQNLEAQEAIKRASDAEKFQFKLTRTSLNLHRPSSEGVTRSSIRDKRIQPFRNEIDHWLRDRERDADLSPVDTDSIFSNPRPSAQFQRPESRCSNLAGRSSPPNEGHHELVEEALVVNDVAVFERCFQHINDFATEGLRTLLYGYRYIDDEEYRGWKKHFLDASTSLVNRREMIEKVGAMVERDLELAGATAIEDKLQKGVPEAIDKLRRAKIKLWMLTGDKRETAINIGHSCRLIKGYSTIIILDHELEDIDQCIANTIIDVKRGIMAHSVVVVDGESLAGITANDHLRRLFLSLAVSVDTVVCCRASPSQKAALVHSIRSKVSNAVTLAIGDGANDIAMIQEAHVGIGITGKEGLQAARTSDYSIAQFRFLTKLLLVHGRWNYIRTCKYTLGTFWKEMMFYLTQALFQRYAGYTGTSLYEPWSLSMFNTLFTSLPVIFMGIFEQDLCSNTLMAVPELYSSLGPRNAGFNIPLYLGWVFMASSQAIIIFFVMLGLFGQAIFTLDNGLYAMGALSFSSCVIIIATKIQFWELHNKTYTCVIAMSLSIGGWFLWNVVLSAVYNKNVIYNVREGLLQRFGRNALWWLTLILVVSACWVLEVCIKLVKCTWMPSDADCFRELEKDEVMQLRFAQAAGDIESRAQSGTGLCETLGHVRTAEE